MFTICIKLILQINCLIVFLNCDLIFKPIVNFHGYKPSSKQDSLHTLQKSCLMSKPVKLPSIAKGVPTLSDETARMWRFQLMINTRRCNKDLGKFIFDDPAKQFSDDLTSSATRTPTQEEMEFKKFADDFVKKSESEDLLGHAHAEILQTLSDEDKANVINIEYPNPDLLMKHLMSEYNVNTRTSRNMKIKEFFNLEMGRDQTFSSFVTTITNSAVEINSMDGSEVEITDALKLVVLLLGVQEYHGDTFSVTTQMLEQSSNLTFARAVQRMKPVARKAEVANKAVAKKAVAKSADANDKTLCYDYRDYGHCPRGDSCGFTHGVPGTKRCPHCSGKHRPSKCPKKPRNGGNQTANLAKADDVDAQERKNDNNRSEGTETAKAATVKDPKLSFFVESDDENDYGSDAEETAKVAKEVPRHSTSAPSSGKRRSAASKKSTSAPSSGKSRSAASKKSTSAPSSGKSRSAASGRSGNSQCAVPFMKLFTFFMFVFGGVVLMLSEMFPNRVRGLGDYNVPALGMAGIGALFFVAANIQGANAVVFMPNDAVQLYNGPSCNLGEVCMMANASDQFSYLTRLKKMQWSVDSACSTHLTNDLSVLDEKSRVSKMTKIEIANGKYMYSNVMGRATMKVRDSRGTVSKLVLHDVLYAPAASSNLISVGRLLQKNHRLVFDQDYCEIINKDTNTKSVIQMFKHMFNVMQVGSNNVSTEQSMVADSRGDLTEMELWHNRLCHYSDTYVHKAVGDVKGQHTTDWCEACVRGGIQRRPFCKKPSDSKHKCNFGSKERRGTEVDSGSDEEMKTQDRLDLVMADTCQPYSDCTSTTGSRYFFLFVDVHTRRKWIRFGKRKSDLKYEFKDWCAQVHNETGRYPIKFMPDGGKEFDNNDLAAYLKDRGILFEITCTDCPNQNAFVERANGVVQRHIHKILAQSGLPNKYWEDAARFSVVVQNAMPVQSKGWETPNAMWGVRRDTTLKYVRTFGCEVWYVVPKSHRRKGDPKSRKGVHLGFSVKHKGYKILDLQTRKIVNTRDVYFKEDSFPFTESKESRTKGKVAEDNHGCVYLQSGDSDAPVPNAGPLELPNSPDYPYDDDDELDEKHNTDGDAIDPDNASVGSDSEVVEPEGSISPPVVRRSSRNTAPVNYSTGMNLKTMMRNLGGASVNVGYTGGDVLGSHSEDIDEIKLAEPDEFKSAEPDQSHVDTDAVASKAVSLGDDFRNMTRKEMLASPFREEFLKAEERELQCLKIHKTYRMVRKPQQKTISCRWCYDVKRDENNKIILFKARLVARGYEQVKGVDYNETFAATAQMKSFRVTLAIAKLLGLKVTQIDISSAFLHGELEEEIYMNFPPGYKPDGHQGSCLKLEKGIYGLKQAGRIWNKKFISTLESIGFVPLTSDTQVLQYRKGKSIMIIGCHVDDATLSSNDEALRKEVIAKLEKEFLVKDLGVISHYLGMRVKTTPEYNEIAQDAYVEKVVARFRMENATEVDTPGLSSQVLTKKDCPEKGSDAEAAMATVPYRQLVGSLMYAYIGTRPDIGAALTKVASFCYNPGSTHWQAAKRILRYAKGTKGQSIRYSGRLYKGDKVTITTYCDSDWAQDPDDRKSTSGYAIMIAGGPVMWYCKKQPTVALSATEAEFVALTEATRDVLWLTQFLGELGIEYETPTIYCDSQSAREWAINASQHQRNKHVAIKYFFIRDYVADKRIKVVYISTKDNVADILTKSTSRQIFRKLQPTLMGCARGLKSLLEKGVRRLSAQAA